MRAPGGLALLAAGLLAACSHGQPPPQPVAAAPLPPVPQEPQSPEAEQADSAAATSAPAPPPAWISRPVTPTAIEVAAQTYRVKPNDSLRRIAAQTGAGSEAIARANGLARPFTIRPGQLLKIPPGRYHEVQPGQSGIAIARAYGVEWSEIVALNDLQEPYILRAGMHILIPSRQKVAAMSPEQRAAAFRLDLDDLITGSEPALASNQHPVRASASPGKPLPSTAVVAAPATFTGRFDWPIDGHVLARFGARGGGVINNGVDIAAPVGTPVRAAADGTVAYVGTDIPSLGRLILIRHGEGWITAYAHADALLVTRGQAVHRGEVIARSGESGNVAEPLLHFEMRQVRSAVDPLRYLPPRS